MDTSRLFVMVVLCGLLLAPPGLLAQDYGYDASAVADGCSIVGWSRKGLVAIAALRDGSNGRGYYRSAVVEIINLVDDQRVAAIKEGGYSDEGMFEGDFAGFWKRRKTEIGALLRSKGILAVRADQRRPRTPETALDTYRLEKWSLGGGDRPDDFAEQQICLVRQDGAVKVAYRYTGPYTSIECIGWQRSPYESRLLLLVRHLETAGPAVGESSLAVVGSHLGTGFQVLNGGQ